MILQASNGCFLTQSGEVSFNERKFEKSMLIASIDEAANWMEIPESKKAQMEEENIIYEPDEVNYNYLKKVETLKNTISERINESFFTVEQALEMKAYFPLWENLIGKDANIEFRFQYGENLYEVIKAHTFSKEWKPDSGTESLYKVVQIEASGSIDDPIEWKKNMELFEGKYYIEDGILYLCTRDSGIALSYTLADLVDQYVVAVQTDQEGGEEPIEPQPIEPDGSLENPYPYVKGETSIEKDKYYLENGIIYLAIQNGGVLVYDLAQVPSIAQKVE
jgi:hypothetical protein